MLPSPNVKWPFSLSPSRLNTGGFARQQNSTFVSLPATLLLMFLPISQPDAYRHMYVFCLERNTFVDMNLAMAGVDMRLEAGAIR